MEGVVLVNCIVVDGGDIDDVGDIDDDDDDGDVVDGCCSVFPSSFIYIALLALFVIALVFVIVFVIALVIVRVRVLSRLVVFILLLHESNINGRTCIAAEVQKTHLQDCPTTTSAAVAVAVAVLVIR